MFGAFNCVLVSVLINTSLPALYLVARNHLVRWFPIFVTPFTFAHAYAQIASFDPVFTALDRSNSPEFAKINKVLEGVVLIPRSCVFSQVADTYLLTKIEKNGAS